MPTPSPAPRPRLRLEPLEGRELLAAGVFDPTFSGDGKTPVAFNAGGFTPDTGNAVAVQPDGKVVVAGTAQTAAGDNDFAVARLNPDGSPDVTFNGSGELLVPFNLGGANDDQAFGVAVQADGKVVLAGFAQRDAAGDYDFAVARLNPNGTFDATFNGSGRQVIAFNLGGANDDQAFALALQPDGKILLAGRVRVTGFGGYDFGVTRLNSDGGIDTAFGTGGRQTVTYDLGGNRIDEAHALTVQPDGKIILAGFTQRDGFNNFDFALARLTANGNLDPLFGGTGQQVVPFDLTGFNDDRAFAVAVQPDGKIVAAGYAQQFGTNTDFALARLNPDATLDTTFDLDGRQTVLFDQGGTNDDQAFGVLLQPDNKIVAAGFAQIPGFPQETDAAAVRLNANGSLDTTFGTAGRAVLPFDFDGAFDDSAAAVALSPDARLILAGTAQRAAPGDTDFAVARVLTDLPAPGITLSSATVVENAPGAAIGDLGTTGFAAGRPVTFLVTDPRFEVVGNQLRLKPGVSLDFEATPAVAVNVTASDNNSPPLALTKSFVITVQDVADGGGGGGIANSDKLGAYRANTDGAYSLDANGNGVYDGPPEDTVFLNYSGPGVIPIVGDWNNDGRDELGFFRDGFWHFDVNGDGVQDSGDVTASFGGAGDTPVVGRFFGPGNPSPFGNGLIIGVFTTRVGGIARFVLDRNANLTLDAGEETAPYGAPGDRVVVGDWTGDGVTKIGVFRRNPLDGVSAIFSLDTNGNFLYDGPSEDSVFGAATDGFVVGDWARVGRDSLGVYRPAPDGSAAQFTLDVNGTRFYEPGVDVVYLYGNASDTFIVGNWLPGLQAMSLALEEPSRTSG